MSIEENKLRTTFDFSNRVRACILWASKVILISGLTLLTIPSLAQIEVEAQIRLSPTGSFNAKTNSLEGEILTQEGKVLAKELKVPLDTLKTGIKLRDDHMRDKYLETKKFPHAILTMGKGQNGKGTAKLKIKDKEKEISGNYQLKDGSIEATFKINLPEFGITGIRYMGVGVKDEVTLVIKAPTREVANNRVPSSR